MAIKANKRIKNPEQEDASFKEFCIRIPCTKGQPFLHAPKAPETVRYLKVSSYEILKHAAEVLNMTLEETIMNGISSYTRRVFSNSYTPNSKLKYGANNELYQQAYNKMIKEGIDPENISPSMLRTATGKSFTTARKWLDHYKASIPVKNASNSKSKQKAK